MYNLNLSCLKSPDYSRFYPTIYQYWLMLWHISDGMMIPQEKNPYPPADDHLFNPKPGFRKRKYSMYLNEKIPFLDAIDDFYWFLPNFFPNSTFYTLKSGGRTHGFPWIPWTRRAGPGESRGRTEPRVLSLLDRPLGPAARPITAPILGSLAENGHLGDRRLECLSLVFWYEAFFLFFWVFFWGTSILTHIQMWKLVHKCLVC